MVLYIFLIIEYKGRRQDSLAAAAAVSIFSGRLQHTYVANALSPLRTLHQFVSPNFVIFFFTFFYNIFIVYLQISLIFQI